MARVYVIYGQGGALTSMGMVRLASRLSNMPGLTVTTNSWKYPGIITTDIQHQPPDVPIILLGYSLGANATTWGSNAVPHREIALAVAYDPSVYSTVTPASPNIKRMLLYHNNGRSVLGHARIPGPQVETTEIDDWHLMVDWDQVLHSLTIAAIGKIQQ